MSLPPPPSTPCCSPWNRSPSRRRKRNTGGGTPARAGRSGEPGAAPDGALRLARLSPRERELVTLVAQGRTDVHIAAQLHIIVRTVGSHLDRIRDKTAAGAAPTAPGPP